MLVQVNDCKNSWIWIIKHIFLINEKTLLNILNTFLCKIMKRKLKCISLNYVLPSDRTLDILEIGPLYNKHTQLNVCEKEELPYFLYLIQIFVKTLKELLSFSFILIKLLNDKPFVPPKFCIMIFYMLMNLFSHYWKCLIPRFGQNWNCFPN